MGMGGGAVYYFAVADAEAAAVPGALDDVAFQFALG